MQMNDQFKKIIAEDRTPSVSIDGAIKSEKITEMANSIRIFENGLYIYDMPEFGPGKFDKYSGSDIYDNGSATSFRLHWFISNIDTISPLTALEMARRMSEATFKRLKQLGVVDAGSLVCLAYDEPGEEQWDFRFFAGSGSRKAARQSLDSDQPVASFEMSDDMETL